MAAYRSWVFETDAPLDAFRYWFYRYLRETGWNLDEADVYDRQVRGKGTRTHLRLRYHEDGILVEAKIRTGLVRGSVGGVVEGLVDAGKRAQVEVRDEEPEPAIEEPNG